MLNPLALRGNTLNWRVGESTTGVGGTAAVDGGGNGGPGISLGATPGNGMAGPGATGTAAGGPPGPGMTGADGGAPGITGAGMVGVMGGGTAAGGPWTVRPGV